MKQVLTTVLAVALLLGLGALAVLAMPSANAPLAAAPVVSAAAPEFELDSPSAFTGPRYNHIALPLDTGTSISPFNAQGLLDYIGDSATQVANLNAASQGLDFWDEAYGFGLVNGVAIDDPVDYPLAVGHPYLILINSTHPADTPFSIVGDVPNEGDIVFTLAGHDPCYFNEIMVPLDQYDQSLDNGLNLANAIGNVDMIAALYAPTQGLDFWDFRNNFGLVAGVTIGTPTLFPVKIGYPYLVCINALGDGDVWP